MRGIGRAVATILLAGAVAGAAAFAHRLGSEPAPAPFGVAALPPAPVSPLVVQAAPGTFPVQAHATRQALRRAVAPPASTPAPRRPIVISRISAPAAPAAPPSKRAQVAPDPPAAPAAPAAPVAPAAPAAPPSKRAQVAPDPPAAPTTPVSRPSAPPPPPEPPASTPVAAPAPTPAPAERTLAQSTPVVADVTTPVTTDDQQYGDHGRRRGHGCHANGGDDTSGDNGQGNEDNGPLVLAAVPLDATTPAPVETPQPPPVDPSSVDVAPTDSNWHEHGDRDHDRWRGHGYDHSN